MSHSAKRPLQVGIMLFDDVEVLDFAGPFEVFSITSERVGTDRLRVFTVAESDRAVCAIGGLTVQPAHTFDSRG